MKEDVADELQTLTKLWDRKSMSGLVMPKTFSQFHKRLKQYREPFATICNYRDQLVSEFCRVWTKLQCDEEDQSLQQDFHVQQPPE